MLCHVATLYNVRRINQRYKNDDGNVSSKSEGELLEPRGPLLSHRESDITVKSQNLLVGRY